MLPVTVLRVFAFLSDMESFSRCTCVRRNLLTSLLEMRIISQQRKSVNRISRSLMPRLTAPLMAVDLARKPSPKSFASSVLFKSEERDEVRSLITSMLLTPLPADILPLPSRRQRTAAPFPLFSLPPDATARQRRSGYPYAQWLQSDHPHCGRRQ